MSSLFKTPKQETPPQQITEKPEVVEDEEEEVKRRKSASVPKGRSDTILSGISNVLKKRLGE